MIRSLTAVALALLMGGQPQQQQKQDVPDAPAPRAPGTLTDLKDQIAPGKSTAPEDSSQSTSPKPSTVPPPAAPQEQNNDTPPEIQTTPGGGYKLPPVYVNFVEVPVTVKDSKHQLVAGLTFRDFKIYENNVQQHIALFSVDPTPLSVAFVIDQSVPQDTMGKVNTALAAIAGSLAAYDEVAIFTYNNGPKEITGFTGAQGPRLIAAIETAKTPGRDMGVPVNSGPLASGPVINGKTVDPNLSRNSAGGGGFITIPKEVHTLNDAILRAAESLSDREKGRRRVVYVITDGKESGSKASFKEVRQYLQTNNIAVYGTMVGDAATWGIGYLDRFHLPLFAQNNIMPKYALATGGSLDAELSINGIEKSFARITEEARTRYTLGYVSHQPFIDGKYRPIDVQVLRPNLEVIAKPGYFPNAQDVKSR